MMRFIQWFRQVFAIRSLRVKLMFWFLIVSLIPLAVMTFYLYNQSSNILIKKEQESALDLVESKVLGLDKWMNERMAEIQLAAKTDILKSGDPQRITPYLKEIEEQSPVYEDVNFANARGITTASSVGSVGVDVTDRPYYIKGMQGQAAFSEILVSKASGARIVVVSAPVKDAAGNVTGVLFGAVNYDLAVQTFLESSQSGANDLDDGNIIVVDEQDRVQTTFVPEHIGKTMDEAGFNEMLKAIVAKGKREIGAERYRSSSGEEYLIAYAPVTTTGYAFLQMIPLQDILADAKVMQRSMYAMMAVTALIVVFFSILISQSIAKPVILVTQHVRRVATGDLTETEIQVRSKDEVGELASNVQHMIESLRNFILKVTAASEQVAAASEQISASTEQVASGSTSQANAAQTINELFKDLSSAMDSVARSADHASELAKQTMSIAEGGGTVVHSSIEGMNRISQQMSKLEQDSIKIGEIIEVIDDIAEQTNLLALNAAIEAARAGEQGRGFAVVADEVRKLAERSGEATKQITQIIKGMQENAQLSVKAVEEGAGLSQQTGEAFNQIIAMVNESAQKVIEIAAASEQQSAQSSEVMLAIENISSITEEAAASSEETATTAQSLSRMAEELNNAIAAFKVK